MIRSQLAECDCETCECGACSVSEGLDCCRACHELEATRAKPPVSTAHAVVEDAFGQSAEHGGSVVVRFTKAGGTQRTMTSVGATVRENGTVLCTDMEIGELRSFCLDRLSSITSPAGAEWNIGEPDCQYVVTYATSTGARKTCAAHSLGDAVGLAMDLQDAGRQTLVTPLALAG